MIERYSLILLILATAMWPTRSQAQTEPQPEDKSAKPAAPAAKKDEPPEFPAGPLEKEYAERLGSEFKLRETKHFFVMYNTDEKVLRDFVQRIEKTFDSVHRFAVGMGIKIKYPKEKLPVVFCATFDEFHNRSGEIGGSPGPAEAAGLYYPRANFSIFYDMANSDYAKQATAKADALAAELKTIKDPNGRKSKTREREWTINQAKRYQDTNNKSVVQHEVAHQLLHNFQVHRRDIPSNPVWFVEGLATLFEPPPGASGAGYNVVNQYRLWRLREADKGGAIPDLADLIKNSVQYLRGGGEQMDKGYANAWGLTYYLAQHKRKEMQAYIDLIKTRKPTEEITPERELADFEKCFGRVDESFKQKWVQFLRKTPYIPPR